MTKKYWDIIRVGKDSYIAKPTQNQKNILQIVVH